MIFSPVAPLRLSRQNTEKCIMECLPGRRKIAVKVVDIFGNDTRNKEDYICITDIAKYKNADG